MMKQATEFTSLLTGFSPKTLEAHDGSIVGLWPDFRIACVNAAWFAFARANDGEPAISRDWSPGRSLMDAVPDDIKPFYRRHLTSCLSSGIAWDHEYACSSADAFRLFHLRAYPLPGRTGLLIVHSHREAHPRGHEDRQPRNFSASEHVDRNDFVHQCANGRRIECLAKRPNRWDGVPPLVKAPHARVSRTICPIRLDFYHPHP